MGNKRSSTWPRYSDTRRDVNIGCCPSRAAAPTNQQVRPPNHGELLSKTQLGILYVCEMRLYFSLPNYIQTALPQGLPRGFSVGAGFRKGSPMVRSTAHNQIPGGFQEG